MKIAIAAMTLAGALTALPVSGAELRVDENVALTELLTGLDVLDAQIFDSGLQVRLYRTGELKECETGREAQTCPRGQLLAVGLVIQGSSGAAMMWRTSPEIGWQFVRRIRAEIVVDDVRDLGAFMHMTPAMGQWRVAIVDSATGLGEGTR